MNIEVMALGVLAGVGALVGVTLFVAMLLRRVVPTNEVHIVQSAKSTTSYGKDTDNGNTYYEWPAWLPVIGVTKVVLPVSVFDLDLEEYEAYDQGRLPFVIDVKGFFRIADSNLAAQRVASFSELKEQLIAIMQGAVRTILASNGIEEIMQGRSKFGDEFTAEVSEQLKDWGVTPVKNIELMDIRDGHDSAVIKNIMKKKESHIEMESRSDVAKNKQAAYVAEITSQKIVDLEKQQAAQEVGLRTADAQRDVELAMQRKEQAVKEEARVTKEKEMAIVQVERTRRADIDRGVAVIEAEQERETTRIQAEAQKQNTVIVAEAEKQKTVIVAEGVLESQVKEAQGTEALGKAKAEAEKALQLAPVEAQIKLAKEIGSNEGYQKYLVTIEQVKASKEVGMAQAGALEKADVKVIANAGSPSTGMKTVMDMFSSQGGVQLGTMLDGFAQTETGKKIVEKMNGAAPTGTPLN